MAFPPNVQAFLAPTVSRRIVAHTMQCEKQSTIPQWNLVFLKKDSDHERGLAPMVCYGSETAAAALIALSPTR